MTARVAFDFTGTSVLVTGGTSGIGHGTATLFRDAGAEVTVTGTRAGADDYDTDLGGMTYRRLRLDDPAAVDEFASGFRQLDVLVNNAGANFPGGLDESAPDGFAASVALNLTAPYRLTVGLHPALRAAASKKAAGGASVVSLSSMSALRAVTMVPGYGAAKAGIISMTRNLAVKWAGDNIRVNVVCPFANSEGVQGWSQAFPDDYGKSLKRVPLQRVGDTHTDIGATVAFLDDERLARVVDHELREHRRCMIDGCDVDGPFE